MKRPSSEINVAHGDRGRLRVGYLHRIVRRINAETGSWSHFHGRSVCDADIAANCGRAASDNGHRLGSRVDHSDIGDSLSLWYDASLSLTRAEIAQHKYAHEGRQSGCC